MLHNIILPCMLLENGNYSNVLKNTHFLLSLPSNQHMIIFSELYYLLKKTKNRIKSDMIRTPISFQILFLLFNYSCVCVFFFFHHFLILYGLNDTKTSLKSDTIRNPGTCQNCLFLSFFLFSLLLQLSCLPFPGALGI